MKKLSVLVLGLAMGGILSVASANEEKAPEYKISSEAVKAGEARLVLAAALISVLDAGKVCEADAYPSEINNLVEGAQLSLDLKVLQDWADQMVPQLSKIRQDFRFRQNLNYVPLDAKVIDVGALANQLTGTKFYGLGIGAVGSTTNVTLMPGGAALVRDLMMDGEYPYTWKETSVSWEVVVRPTSHGFNEALLKIHSTLYRFEQNSGEIRLVPDGVPQNEEMGGTLTTTDSYCEA